jgi:hypothetical protein
VAASAAVAVTSFFVVVDAVVPMVVLRWLRNAARQRLEQQARQPQNRGLARPTEIASDDSPDRDATD